jgi:hypothetical protein
MKIQIPAWLVLFYFSSGSQRAVFILAGPVSLQSLQLTIVLLAITNG